MKFESKKTIASVRTDGVKFTIRVLGEPARARVEVETAEARSKQRDLALEYMELGEDIRAILPAVDYPADKSPEDIFNAEREREEALSKEDRRQLTRLRAKQSAVEALHLNIYNAEIAPAWLRAGFLSIEGFDQGDSKKVTAEDIINGPRALFIEIAEAIYEEANLLPEPTKNSESPTSLEAVEVGTTRTTTAPNASGTPGTN